MGAGTAAAAPATQDHRRHRNPAGSAPPRALSFRLNWRHFSALDIPELPDFAADLNTQAQQFLAGINPGTSARTVQPVSGTLTSTLRFALGAHHGGLDIAAPIGTPILWLQQPTARSSTAGPASGFGLWVRVQHDDGTVTTYGHVNDYQVNVGQRVNAGQQIATVGNRGQSTGPHLHFEVAENGAKVDPAAWLQARGVAVTWVDNS